MNTIDWDRLKIIHAIVETGSFQAAAEKFGINQSNITRNIQIIETQLGCQVLHRSRKGVKLTESGQLLYDLAQEIITKTMHVQHQIHAIRDEMKGKITIATTSMLNNFWLSRIIPEFMTLYPNIYIEAISLEEDSTRLYSDADINISSMPITQEYLVCEFMLNYPGFIYTSQNYLAKYGEPKSIEDLANHRIITLKEPARYKTDRQKISWLLYANLPNGQRRQPFLELDDNMNVLTYTADGAGIAQMPHYVTTHFPSLVQIMNNLYSSDQGFIHSKYLIYPKIMNHNQKFIIFRDFLYSKIHLIHQHKT